MALVASPVSCHFRQLPVSATHPHSSSTIPNSNLSSSHQISTLCESGKLAEAVRLLQNNIGFDASCETKSDAISTLLQHCGRRKDIETGREIHKIVFSEFGNDFVLNTRLITMYSICGSPVDSRLVFDQLERRNLFLWNALISGYCRNELWVDSILMFVELLCATEFKPDNFTLPCVFKACSGISDVRLGETVYGMAVKMGLILDVFVGNALIAMYGKCKFLEEAIKLFRSMPVRNLVSWNSIMLSLAENGYARECFDTLKQMFETGEEGLVPDVATLVTILPVCATEGEAELGNVVHCLAIKLGLNKDLMVNNSLIDMYLKCGYLLEAGILFNKSEHKNVVSWNTMIAGYSKVGDVNGTFDVLRKMQVDKENAKGNEVTVLNVLSVCSQKSELVRVKELHGYSFRHGFQNDELVANAFTAAYAKCGSLRLAECAFDDLRHRTVSSWNAIIGGFAQNGDPDKALNLYQEMTNSGLNPDWFSIGSILLACANKKSLRYGKETHGYIVRNGLDSDSFICISLLSLYTQCGNLSTAKILFHKIDDKNPVSWNTMLTGYLQNGHPDEALSFFRTMLSGGVKPTGIAITSVLGACSELSVLRLGKETHCFALKSNITDRFVCCSIIDMYAKCGCIDLSQRVFNELKEKDVASWNILINGLGVHGRGKEAIGLYEEMQTLGLYPDSLTFIGILMSCSHSGMIEEGLRYFNQMQNLYEIEPKLEHYACVVDMLARAGRLNDALKLVDEMPMDPDTGIWSSLLNCCRVYGYLESGKKIAQKFIELEPDKAENFVLVSNLYAQSGNWDEVRRIRGRMKDSGLQKDAGRSWIELGERVYNFLAGDDMLSESQEIRDMWEKLEQKIIEIGYQPDLGSVLHEVEDSEKIEMLRNHSEKLAVSLGLLKTAEGVTLRVFKNLRMCRDCHNAFKLISEVSHREIVVRDSKRFHHFRNGGCSCNDYW